MLAQDSVVTTLDSSKVYFFYNDFEKRGPDFLSYIDTLITGEQKYDPLIRPGNYYATLGNVGLAHEDMIYSKPLKTGFNFGIHSFDKYRFHSDSVKHYWVGRPYTYLYYVMGSKKEQNLHIDHSQNVSSWLNLGLRFRYIHAPGYYENQKSDNKNFVFKARFQTKNYRYMVLANYIHNKLKMEENGGIKYDSVFEQNIEQTRKNIVVNLSTANNYVKDNVYYVKQFFKLQKGHRFRQEDLTDSTKKIPTQKISLGNISLSSYYSRTVYLYEQSTDDNNGFYQYTFDSVNPTYDSTLIDKFENVFSWTNADNARQQLLTFNFALRNIYAELSVDSARKIYNQLIPSGEVTFSVSDKLKLDFFGDMVFGNSYVGNYNLSGKLSFFSKFGDLEYTITNTLQDVDRIYQNYSSNHFLWSNSLKKESYLVNTFNYRYKNLLAGFSFSNVGNFVYFDTLGIPAQLDGSMSVLNLHLGKVFNVGNFSFDARIIYQKASKEEAIRVPEFVGDLSIYYTKDLFKKASIVQIGLDFLYNTSYKAYAYMPATRSFYVQNEKEIGNFVYADVFLNLQVKRARLFLKYINLMSLFNIYDYYTVPSYPMQDDGIRFGVSWMFYD